MSTSETPPKGAERVLKTLRDEVTDRPPWRSQTIRSREIAEAMDLELTQEISPIIAYMNRENVINQVNRSTQYRTWGVDIDRLDEVMERHG